MNRRAISDPIPKVNFTEMSAFLTSFDGLKRTPDSLRSLSTALRRLSYATARVSARPGAIKYRVLFSREEAEKQGLTTDELQALEKEFRHMTKGFIAQALVYYKGPMSKEQLIEAVKEDHRTVIKKMYGEDAISDDENDLGPEFDTGSDYCNS